MTKDEIKKALKCCETDFCCSCPYYEYRGCEAALKRYALDLITEQEKEIERLKEEKKQAQIDILNKAKKCSCCDNFFPDGKWHKYVLVSDIDILVEEAQNGEDKG